MASTLTPMPSSTQCRGPFSLTTAAPMSAAIATASRLSHRSWGHSFKNCVPNTSASKRPSRKKAAMISP